MIRNRTELKEYILTDAIANRRSNVKPHFFGDEIWKFQLSLRYLSYYGIRKKNPVYCVPYLFWRLRYHNLSIKLGFLVPYTMNIGKGFSIAHYGLLTINGAATIGENCRIHEGVCIGATNGGHSAAKIGNNVFIGTGASLIGSIEIADNVAIAAGAVVTKSIKEAGTTWGGVPARKISNNDSKSNLAPGLFV